MKKCVYVNLMDIDKRMRESVSLDGDGFLIDDSIDYYNDYYDRATVEKLKKLSSVDSIFSWKFGLSIKDEDDTLVNMYSCRCGNLSGSDHLYDECPSCGTIVERVKPKAIGWFWINPRDPNTMSLTEEERASFKPIKMLHPYLCYLMYEHIYKGATLIEKLNGGKKKANKENIAKIEDFKWKDLFFNKEALKSFIIKYMNQYKELLLKYEDRWYVSALPVISKNFRTMEIKEKLGVPDVRQSGINSEYMKISACIKAINEDPNMIKSRLINKLKTITQSMGKIIQELFKELGGDKESFWRTDAATPRVDNSGRLVLEASTDELIPVDGLRLPLDFVRATFAKDVTSICKKMKIAPNKISDILNINYNMTADERGMFRYEIFPKIKNPYVYINREPCIYTTSVLGLKIYGLTDDMVMRHNFFIAPSMNADYDGDTLPVIVWDTPDQRKRIYESLGPTRSIINTVEIKYNPKIGPSNNAAVTLYKGFCEDPIIEEVS